MHSDLQASKFASLEESKLLDKEREQLKVKEEEHSLNEKKLDKDKERVLKSWKDLEHKQLMISESQEKFKDVRANLQEFISKARQET